MASRKTHLQPISRAQRRRSMLPWYFDLSNKGLFLLVVLAASLLALLALAQTGRVVAVGYHIEELRQEEEDLRWEQDLLLFNIAREIDPAVLELWARDNNMEVMEPEDVVFLPVPPDHALKIDRPASMAQEP